MLSGNPFVDLSSLIPPAAMQAYLILMAVLVFVGTVLDMLHKGSARYFFENAEKARQQARRQLGGGERFGIAIKTVANEVLTSGEFHNPRRRVSHLFTMYGFLVFVVSTVVLIFCYPTEVEAGIWPALWHLGALALCFGAGWFWFFIRVDVSAEGVKWYNFNGRGDLFIVGLVGTAVFALLWSITRGAGAPNAVFLVLFVAASTVLFGSVYWSKFAHMFFKPAAAYQKRCTRADGSRENLPDDYDPADPAVQSRYPDIPTYMGTSPPNMGRGFSAERPSHY
ncbi:MAG TPA: adenylyl-sulfate reductase [Thiobacillaceae bacterium]|nr:adenylyl-sulfate reductase [Thiobacillaceae bacterium]HNU63872.1 adenylyl-sulfate reductase [Thiobacillaceae bacterium]